MNKPWRQQKKLLVEFGLSLFKCSELPETFWCHYLVQMTFLYGKSENGRVSFSLLGPKSFRGSTVFLVSFSPASPRVPSLKISSFAAHWVCRSSCFLPNKASAWPGKWPRNCWDWCSAVGSNQSWMRLLTHSVHVAVIYLWVSHLQLNRYLHFSLEAGCWISAIWLCIIPLHPIILVTFQVGLTRRLVPEEAMALSRSSGAVRRHDVLITATRLNSPFWEKRCQWDRFFWSRGNPVVDKATKLIEANPFRTQSISTFWIISWKISWKIWNMKKIFEGLGKLMKVFSLRFGSNSFHTFPRCVVFSKSTWTSAESASLCEESIGIIQRFVEFLMFLDSPILWYGQERFAQRPEGEGSRHGAPQLIWDGPGWARISTAFGLAYPAW